MIYQSAQFVQQLLSLSQVVLGVMLGPPHVLIHCNQVQVRPAMRYANVSQSARNRMLKSYSVHVRKRGMHKNQEPCVSFFGS